MTSQSTGKNLKMNDLRSKIIRLAHRNPSIRPHLLRLLDEGIRKAAEGSEVPDKLPEDPWRYFTKIPEAVLVDLKDLTPIRAREKGIENARKYMWGAYNGERGKRKPISLKDNGDGTYTVLDGNSTFANAKASGWKQIPGVVEG